MTGLVRKATLLTVCGLLLAGAAMAAVPSQANSTVPSLIKLVGTKTGVADPLGTYSATIRDLANNVISNSSVVVDFSGCSDSKISSTQIFAGLTADCPSKTVRALTNGSGVVTFDITGATANASNSPGAGVGCAKVFADGVLVSPAAGVTVAIYDQDGVSGLGANDLAGVLSDIFGTYRGRSDFDGTGALGANDLAVWLNGFFLGNSVTSASPYCP